MWFSNISICTFSIVNFNCGNEWDYSSIYLSIYMLYHLEKDISTASIKYNSKSRKCLKIINIILKGIWVFSFGLCLAVLGLWMTASLLEAYRKHSLPHSLSVLWPFHTFLPQQCLSPNTGTQHNGIPTSTPPPTAPLHMKNANEMDIPHLWKC